MPHLITPGRRIDFLVQIHSPGASTSLEDAQFNRSKEWRYLMEYFVIDLHDTLLRNELGDDSPYVTVGVQFRPHMPHDIPEVPLHYSGNFWMPSVPSSIHCPTSMRWTSATVTSRSFGWPADDCQAYHKDCWTMQKDECDPPGLDLYQCMVKRSAYESYRACRGKRGGKKGEGGGDLINKRLVNGKLGNFGSYMRNQKRHEQ